MRSGASFMGRSDYRGVTFTTLLLTTVIIIGGPLKLQAQAGIDYYSWGTPPTGMKSFEPLIAKRWDFTGNQAAKIANHWPICLN
jgi:hypothetical protein